MVDSTEKKPRFTWSDLIAITALVVAGLGWWDQKRANDKSVKEVIVEHLEQLIPGCKGYTDRVSTSFCVGCVPTIDIPASDSRNPIEIPLLMYRYRECDRLSKTIESELSCFDYLLLAIAADRVGFLDDASCHFLNAWRKAQDTKGEFEDDVVIIANLAHFRYMHLNTETDFGVEIEEFRDNKFLGKNGYLQYHKAIDLVPSAFGDLQELMTAELKAQWALDEFMHDHTMEEDKNADKFAKAKSFATDAINLFRNRPSYRGRYSDFCTQLILIAENRKELESWIDELRKIPNIPIPEPAEAPAPPAEAASVSVTPAKAEDSPGPWPLEKSVVLPAKTVERIVQETQLLETRKTEK